MSNRPADQEVTNTSNVSYRPILKRKGLFDIYYPSAVFLAVENLFNRAYALPYGLLVVTTLNLPVSADSISYLDVNGARPYPFTLVACVN